VLPWDQPGLRAALRSGAAQYSGIRRLRQLFASFFGDIKQAAPVIKRPNASTGNCFLLLTCRKPDAAGRCGKMALFFLEFS
jgi:hypothetical protein